MSKVCIVFDRLRSEEKMLQKEASDLGCETSMLDAKISQINTDSKREDYDLGDVVLERCVSYFRGLHFTASLEFMDVPTINTLRGHTRDGRDVYKGKKCRSRRHCRCRFNGK